MKLANDSALSDPHVLRYACASRQPPEHATRLRPSPRRGWPRRSVRALLGDHVSCALATRLTPAAPVPRCRRRWCGGRRASDARSRLVFHATSNLRAQRGPRRGVRTGRGRGAPSRAVGKFAARTGTQAGFHATSVWLHRAHTSRAPRSRLACRSHRGLLEQGVQLALRRRLRDLVLLGLHLHLRRGLSR